MILRNSIKPKLLLLIAIILLFAGTLIFARILELPYRLFNSDIFHQLAVLKEFESGVAFKDPFFTDGPPDLHAGPYYYTIFLFTKFVGTSYYTALYVMIAINTTLLALSLYFLGKSFRFNTKECAVLVLISYLGWGSFEFFFAGIYEFSNLLVSGSFPASIGVSYMFINLGIAKRYLEKPNIIYLAILAPLTASLFVSHILSGVILFSLVGLLVLEKIIIDRKISRKIIGLLSALLAGLALSIFIWPPFGFLDLLSQSQTVEVGKSDKVTDNLFAVSKWANLLGLTTLGVISIPYLVKTKRYHIILFLVFTALMTASYMLPIRISLYWRYFPLLFLALSLSLTIGMSQLNARFKAVLLIGITAIGLVNVHNRIQLLLKQTPTPKNQYSEVASLIPSDAVLFSDPNTSYHLAALYDITVVSVPYNHANPAYIKQSKARYEESMELLAKSDFQAQDEFYKKYGVDYVLINHNYFPDYILLTNKRQWLADFQVSDENESIFRTDEFELYKIK